MTFEPIADLSEMRAHSGRILIVDDTPENLAVLAKVLRQHDYDVVTALNGERALQAAGRMPPQGCSVLIT